MSGLLLLGTCTVISACDDHLRATQRSFREAAQKRSVSIFDLYFDARDDSAAQDVAKVLGDALGRFRREFKHAFENRVGVEIYADQASYDAHLMDPSVAGSPACSGHRTIQMVSPRSPIRIAGLPYNTRLSMAAHELAHLFINELNGKVPLWLSEGTASFAGDADGYRALCRLPQVARLLKSPPSLDRLEASYSAIPAADVYSFTAVDYIVRKHGWGAVVELIRSPADFERLLGVSRGEFTKRWHTFVIEEYTSGAPDR